jgi:hypothetical protein
LLGDVDVLVVNRVEAATLSTGRRPRDVLPRSLRHAGAREVMRHARSRRACSGATSAPRRICPPCQRQAIDTVGAGDAFCGTLLAALRATTSRCHWRCSWAQAVAALSSRGAVRKPAFPSRAAMRDLLSVSPLLSNQVIQSIWTLLLASDADSTDCIKRIFGRARGVVIGVIHCPAFPGSPRYQGASSEAMYERGARRCRCLCSKVESMA